MKVPAPAARFLAAMVTPDMKRARRSSEVTSLFSRTQQKFPPPKKKGVAQLLIPRAENWSLSKSYQNYDLKQQNPSKAPSSKSSQC